MKIQSLLFSLLLTCALPASADLLVDAAASDLSFVSVKNAAVAEVSRFTGLTGGVDASGDVQLDIEAASVATQIEIRDQRLREHLLEVSKFPVVRVQAKVDMAAINAMAVGERRQLVLPVTLTLHGVSQQYSSHLNLVKLADGVQVSTVQPLIIRLADFNLLPGVEKLQALANLSSIAVQVPVSAVLVFR